MIKSVLAGARGCKGVDPLFKPAFSPRRGTREPRFNRYLVAPLAPTIGFLALLPSSYRFFLSARIFLQAPLREQRYPPSSLSSALAASAFPSIVRGKKGR